MFAKQLNQLDSGFERTKEREIDESSSSKKKETKIGHRRINEDGQITYKKVLFILFLFSTFHKVSTIVIFTYFF